MQRNNASRSLFFYFNLRQDYSNLLRMKENMRKLNIRYIPIYFNLRQDYSNLFHTQQDKGNPTKASGQQD